MNWRYIVIVLNVICAMQIMSGTQPDTLIKALPSTKIRQSVVIFLEAHGSNDLLKEKQFRVLCHGKFDYLVFEVQLIRSLRP